MSAQQQYGRGTALAPTNGTVIEQIRQRGANAIAELSAMSEMESILSGCEWGSGSSMVRGSSFSPATRAAFAKFCVITRANPQIHVDILGGKPYLNSQYYKDLVSSHSHFIREDQRNISKTMSAALRAQAEQALKDHERLGTDSLKQEAANLLTQAREIDRLRAEYAVPDWAKEAYETTIWRYTENAPLQLIAGGKVENPDAFIRQVRECNWAGGKPTADPVGNAEPAKTARSRSFRRTANKAFAAWFQNYDQQIERAEEMIEADYEIIRSERLDASTQSITGETQAVRTGAGEPSAARATAAQPLPTDGDIPPGARESDASDADTRRATAAAQDDDSWRPAARNRFFGNLNAAGVPEAERKAWAAKNNLPGSTAQWTREQFKDADEVLTAPARKRYVDGCSALGVDPAEYALLKLGRAADTVKEFNQLVSAIGAELDADSEQGSFV